jgi:hypothetical protein
MMFVILVGHIYLEVDLQTPVAIGQTSLDGYTGSTFTSSTAAVMLLLLSIKFIRV